ncbi:WXG100 family type VII secretion target [Bacillus mycoides]|uniref:WXG100 family type VII secretion target n=1 Tax=Bacillus mycoides TaxID=1405 RepID=UPI003D656BC4
MDLIKITPERLEQSAKLVKDIRQTLDNMHKDLYNQTEYIASQWTGATSQNFYQMFNEAKPKIFEVNNLLDKISEELKHSAKKFREVDQMDYMLAKARSQNDVEYLQGKVEWKEGDRFGGTLEGAVVEAKNSVGTNGELTMKALSGKVDLNIPYSFDAAKDDLFAGNIIGGKIEGSVLENEYSTKVPILTPTGFEMKDIKITQKFGEGNFAYGVDEYTLKNAAEVTTNKYEVEMELFHIPEFVPFIGDKDVVVKGELGLGTFGYDFKLGKETGLYVGDGYGLGGTIKFED